MQFERIRARVTDPREIVTTATLNPASSADLDPTSVAPRRTVTVPALATVAVLTLRFLDSRDLAAPLALVPRHTVGVS
jgi:hypothetical protein